jgi:hypothetical protein
MSVPGKRFHRQLAPCGILAEFRTKHIGKPVVLQLKTSSPTGRFIIPLQTSPNYGPLHSKSTNPHNPAYFLT